MKNYRIKFNDKVYEVEVEELAIGSAAPTKAPVKESAPKAPQNTSNGGGEEITAPMPGNIIDIKVNVGDSVKSGQVLVILEAMKLENEIVAPRDGVVKAINTSKGSVVELGNSLITLG